MARRPFSSGLAAGERSRSVVAPPINPLVPVSAAGSSITPTIPGEGGGGGGLPLAPLPDYTDVAHSPGNYIVGVNKPASATPGYSVSYGIDGAPLQVATSFPFQIVTAASNTPFQLFANDTGFAQSPLDQQSWDSLFS